MRRALPLLIAFLIGLAACGGPDPRAAFTDSRIPPGLEQRFYPPPGWAWGLLQVDKAPPVRYGVAGPPRQPIGQVIILPGHDTAEAWFWTVSDLVARGYVVWVLEGSGQGGSGRYRLPRDLVDAPSLDPDVAAVAALATQLSRQRPRYLIATSTSAPIAVRAAALGLQLDGVLLLDPDLRSAAERNRELSKTVLSKARWMHRLGLGRLRLPGATAWRHAEPIDGDLPGGPGEASTRHWLTRRWQRANPDLRMGGPSIDWRLAYDAEASAALAAWPRVRTPTLVVGDDICGGRANCRHIQSGRPLERMAAHAEFLDQILGFIDPKAAALAPPPPPATLDPDA